MMQDPEDRLKESLRVCWVSPLMLLSPPHRLPFRRQESAWVSFADSVSLQYWMLIAVFALWFQQYHIATE